MADIQGGDIVYKARIEGEREVVAAADRIAEAGKRSSQQFSQSRPNKLLDDIFLGPSASGGGTGVPGGGASSRGGGWSGGSWAGGNRSVPLAPLGQTVWSKQQALAPLGPTVWSQQRADAPLGPTVWSQQKGLAPLGSAPAMRYAGGYDPAKDKDSDNLLKKMNAIGLAYSFRHAASGGPAGIAGWGIGAAAGGAFGPGGAMLGSMIGGMAGGAAMDMAGLANPGEKSKFDRAYADLKATIGRNFTPVLKASTDTIRFVADVFAGGRGRSFGAAPDESLGRRIGGPEDIYPFIQQSLSSQSTVADSARYNTASPSRIFGMMASGMQGSLGGGSVIAMAAMAWLWGASSPSQPQVAE